MPNALVVADDLTGAMDTGHGFAARGRGVRVALRGAGAPTDATESRDSADVFAVDADTRDRDAGAAAERVADAVAAHPAPLVYEKVDSTLRGNVVAGLGGTANGFRARLGTGDMTDGALRWRLDGIALLLILAVSLLSGLVFGRTPDDEAGVAALSFVALLAAALAVGGVRYLRG